MLAATSPTRWDGLIGRVDAQRIEARIPAAALVIVERGAKPLLQTWGATPTTPFRVGSISKTFTALTMLSLAEDKNLPLASPVRSHIADAFSNPFAPGQPVRIRHLLELTAGLADLSGTEFNDNTFFSLKGALALNPNNRTVHWPPGIQHSYTNVAPGLTSLLIERLSGKKFEAVAEDRVLRPLGMSKASYLPVDGLPGGFKADGKTEIPYWNVTYRAFGALNAAPVEMAKFLDALIANRNVGPLNATTRAALFTPGSTLAARAGLPIGYGSGAYGWISNGQLFVGHGGDADGYRSRYGVLGEAGRGYFIVINTDNPRVLRAMVRSVEQFLTDDLPAPEPPKPTTPTDLARLSGTFYPASVRFGMAPWMAGKSAKVTVTEHRENNQPVLHFKRRGRLTTLLPLSNDLFARAGDPVATVAFVRSPGGALHIQGELGNYFRLTRPCPAFASNALDDLCRPTSLSQTGIDR